VGKIGKVNKIKTKTKIKMKKTMVLMAVLAIVALLVFGCTRGPNYNYPTGGYAAYGQQGQPSQGYVGGGCAVAGPDPSNVDISEPAAAV